MADFLGRISAHILGKATIEQGQLDAFLGASGSQNLRFSFLLIFNTCAGYFSQDPELKQVIVEFFELHYFDYLKLLAQENNTLLVFRLVFSLQASLEALKQVCPNKITEILCHLAAMMSGDAPIQVPEYIAELVGLFV